MTGPHGQHHEAVAGAIFAIGELQEAISVVSDRRENAMGAVIMAVGQSPFVESARNAMNFIGEISVLSESMFRLTEAAKEELRRYKEGF